MPITITIKNKKKIEKQAYKGLEIYHASLSTSEMESASTPSMMEMKTRRQAFRSQVSTLDTRRRQAVCVRRAFKKYGSKNNPQIVLDGLNMTVPKGAM